VERRIFMMKNLIGMTIVLALMILAWGSDRMSLGVTTAEAHDSDGPVRGGKPEVVVIVCETHLVPLPPTLTVLASSSSPGAPAVALWIECAHGLASVLTAGYRIREAVSVNGLRVQYILVNR
jgi:hypothetical protein